MKVRPRLGDGSTRSKMPQITSKPPETGNGHADSPYGSRRNQAYRPLDLGLQASRAGRKYISTNLSHSVSGSLL